MIMVGYNSKPNTNLSLVLHFLIVTRGTDASGDGTDHHSRCPRAATFRFDDLLTHPQYVRVCVIRLSIGLIPLHSYSILLTHRRKLTPSSCEDVG
jgi:hypothetical protein